MNSKEKAAGTIRASLRYPAFRLLLTGLAVSQLGDWLYNLALVGFVVGRTHSMLWAGAATAARVVPFVALGPLGGVIADRFDRRRLMIVCDLVRFALMALLALFAVTSLPIALAPLIAAAATAAATPYLPSVAAVTPRLVPDADLPGANAARTAVTSIGIIVGPAMSGLLLLLGSPALAFALNAATFGLSALMVASVRGAGGAFRPARGDQRPAGLLREVAAGAAVLRAHPQALRLVGADIICSALYGMQTVLLLTVSDRTGLGMHGYGYLFAGIGVGALAGTGLASRALRCPHPRAVLVAALAAVGLPMPLLVFAHWPAAAMILVAVSGAGAVLVEISAETGLQRTLDPETFGRAYGLALPASLGGIVAGSLIAPLLTSVLGDSGALVASGALVIAYALAMLRPSQAAAPAAPARDATAPAVAEAGNHARELLLAATDA